MNAALLAYSKYLLKRDPSMFLPALHSHQIGEQVSVEVAETLEAICRGETHNSTDKNGTMRVFIVKKEAP